MRLDGCEFGSEAAVLARRLRLCSVDNANEVVGSIDGSTIANSEPRISLSYSTLNNRAVTVNEPTEIVLFGRGEISVGACEEWIVVGGGKQGSSEPVAGGHCCSQPRLRPASCARRAHRILIGRCPERRRHRRRYFFQRKIQWIRIDHFYRLNYHALFCSSDRL